jgi:N-carbamoylputrescine amidase
MQIVFCGKTMARGNSREFTYNGELELYMKKIVTVGIVQMHSGDDVDANLKKGTQGIREAASKGAQIVCLPELFNAPYFCQERDDRYFALAEPVPGPTTSILGEVAAECNVAIITSLFERADKFYNTAIVVDANGQLSGVYRKMHIPDDPNNYYDEAYYFAPGDLGFQAFPTRYATVGPMICFDQWFPEGARIEAEQGAEILFYPTAIGWPLTQRSEDLNRAENNMWKTIQIAHGIANNCFVVACNRVGIQDSLKFWGSSFISDPYGRVLVLGPADSEANLVAECDMSVIDQKKKDWPFLESRRIRYDQSK